MSASPPRSQKYLDSEASLQELLTHMAPAAQAEWEAFGHLRVEPAFQDRVFVVYQASGKTSGGGQKPPVVHTTIRVLSFIARDETGCTVRLLNEVTNDELEVGHVPKKLFNYPIFVAIPPLFTLRYDARQHAGRVMRSLSYLLFVKARNKADFFSKDNFYMETPNRVRLLYPGVDLKLDL